MNLSVEEYKRMSIHEGMPDGEIAKKLHYSASHLSNWKRKNDLVHRSTDNLDWEIVEALSEVRPLRWIADKHDMEWKTFYRWYKRNKERRGNK